MQQANANWMQKERYYKGFTVYDVIYRRVYSDIVFDSDRPTTYHFSLSELWRTVFALTNVRCNIVGYLYGQIYLSVYTVDFMQDRINFIVFLSVINLPARCTLRQACCVNQRVLLIYSNVCMRFVLSESIKLAAVCAIFVDTTETNIHASLHVYEHILVPTEILIRKRIFFFFWDSPLHETVVHACACFKIYHRNET